MFILDMMRYAMAHLLIALWAVVALPTLCMGGWLGHACAPVSPAGHECEHNEDTSLPHEEKHDDDCKHESDCPADPCSQVVKTDDDDVTDVTPYVYPSITLCLDLRLQNQDPALIHITQARPPDAHHRMGRPFPDRALPLLM